MWKLKYHADKSMVTFGPYVWAFSRMRTDDDYYYDDDDDYPIIPAYRSFVLHVGRLHINAEWRV